MTPNFHGIIDSTLREGEQTPGVNFSQELRYEIITQISQVGVEEIELGVASEKTAIFRIFLPLPGRQAKDGNVWGSGAAAMMGISLLPQAAGRMSCLCRFRPQICTSVSVCKKTGPGSCAPCVRPLPKPGHLVFLLYPLGLKMRPGPIQSSSVYWPRPLPSAGCSACGWPTPWVSAPLPPSQKWCKCSCRNQGFPAGSTPIMISAWPRQMP